MQPNQSIKFNIIRIAQKETALFFSSPIAYLFIGVFVAVTLFIFFCGEAFFARNIADVRPMFEWMPVLLIFLCSTLTMKLWSEEIRTGTIEYVHTLSIPLWHFVAGKFLACLTLLCIALTITFPLPITVSILGDLDWGPVISGYIAVLLLGSAYVAIGLAVSARSDNQIFSLITACGIGGLLYFIGTPAITDFFSHQNAEFLRQLGTGSRFEDITRGVIDIRDLYYYVSLTLVFLAINTYFLEEERWTPRQKTKHHKQWQTITSLLVVNLLTANLWLSQLPELRWDSTEGKQYSISEATQIYLAQLQEPLLIRGYFSQKTHPLLAPLVPQIKDLLNEYEVMGKGKVRVEFIDPQQKPDLEEEANTQFGIKPMPFQVADRYQSSIVSSYFNVLVQYGDEHEVLSFRDLIEVNARAESDIEVLLRNPEHDVTRAIKTVLQNYQSAGNLFDTVKKELTLTGYISANEQLPEQLITYKQTIEQQLKEIQAKSNNKLTVKFVEPEADGGAVAQKIADDYGFQPMATSILSNQRFYFYLTLSGGDQIVQIPLGDFTQSNFERNVDAAIKRFATGFTKNVALVTPAISNSYSSPSNSSFNQLTQRLGAELNVIQEDLSDGSVSGEADILMLVSPRSLDEKQLFAIDQFLMKGGTVIAATSPFSVNLMGGNFSISPVESGLSDWLMHHGLTIENTLVMDVSNASFPIPVTRNVGGFQLQEMRMLDYPYFVDIRDGLNKENLITSELSQLTMPWSSPITVEQKKEANIHFTSLISSSTNAWTSPALDIMPRVSQLGETSYSAVGETAEQLLGVIAQGSFNSYFANKTSPLLENENSIDDNAENNVDHEESDTQLDISSVIKHAPESARIILFSSNDLAQDSVLQLTGGISQTNYLNSLQLLVNSIDWSLEDRALMSIRSRGNFNRTLPPLAHTEQIIWEYSNYILAFVILSVVAWWVHKRRKRKQRYYLTWLTQ